MKIKKIFLWKDILYVSVPLDEVRLTVYKYTTEWINDTTAWYSELYNKCPAIGIHYLTTEQLQAVIELCLDKDFEV